MLVGENIGKHSFVHLSANKRLNRMNKSQILDFIAFYKTSQLFLIWGCTLFCTYRELQRKCWSYSTGTYNFQAAPENLRPVGLRFQAFWSPTNGKFSNDQPQSQPWQICRCLPPCRCLNSLKPMRIIEQTL